MSRSSSPMRTRIPASRPSSSVSAASGRSAATLASGSSTVKVVPFRSLEEVLQGVAHVPIVVADENANPRQSAELFGLRRLRPIGGHLGERELDREGRALSL